MKMIEHLILSIIHQLLKQKTLMYYLMFFDPPIKSKEEIYEKIIEMGRNSD